MNTSFDEQVARAMRLVTDELDHAREHQDTVTETVGIGLSEDGLITVRVSAGVVQDLEINPRAMRLDSHTLRDSILQAIAAATADYTETLRARSPVPAVDPEQLLRDLGGPGQRGSMLGDFHRRVEDIQYNLDQLRRDLKG